MFGVADYAASTQARTTNIGGANPDYAVLTDAGEAGVRERHWGDQWHFALSRMVVACRAYGLRPIDGPFGDYQDAEGYTAAARRAAQLGCEGKWAIHPSPDRARQRGVHAAARPRSTAPAGSSRRWSRRRPRARAPSRWTAS